MKKNLFIISLFLLGLSNIDSAHSAGLYISAGYANAEPDVSLNTLTASSSDTGPGGAYAGFDAIYGWPTSNDSNASGLWAKPWNAGLPEKWEFYPSKSNTYSVAIGWAIPKNPFRFELEWLKTSFDVRDWSMFIYPGADGAWCDQNNGNGTCYPTGSYQFDLAYEDFEIRDFDVNSYMLNVLFEIPGFGNIDPYIGYGYGFTKIDTTQTGISGGTNNESSHQLIAGVEYRVPDSPLIIGLEYRKLSMDTGDERDDANTSFDYSQDMIMFKIKYDFVSDTF